MDAERRVVCGYDGSEHADRALVWAADEAERRGASLGVLSALNWPTGPEVWAANMPDTRAVDRAHAVLDDAVERLEKSHPGLEVRYRVDEGGVVQALLAESASAELVVVGARGLGGFRGMLLGSVSTAVAEHATCPVVVVRPPRSDGEPVDGQYAGEVVVGVDGSPAAEAALAFAFAEAQLRGSGVVAVMALRRDTFTQALGDAGLASVRPEHTTSAASFVLERAVDPWTAKHPDVRVRQTVVVGHPVFVLTDVAAGAALLVTGTRNLGGLRAALIGSVSRGVLHHASGPVAVVPGAA